MGQKYYAEGSTSRRAQNLEDRVTKEERPDTKIRSTQSPDPKGSSRMKLRSDNPDPEKVMYYI